MKGKAMPPAPLSFSDQLKAAIDVHWKRKEEANATSDTLYIRTRPPNRAKYLAELIEAELNEPIPPDTIKNWLNGSNDPPEHRKRLIAQALGKRIAYFADPQPITSSHFDDWKSYNGQVCAFLRRTQYSLWLYAPTGIHFNDWDRHRVIRELLEGENKSVTIEYITTDPRDERVMEALCRLMFTEERPEILKPSIESGIRKMVAATASQLALRLSPSALHRSLFIRDAHTLEAEAIIADLPTQLPTLDDLHEAVLPRIQFISSHANGPYFTSYVEEYQRVRTMSKHIDPQRVI